MTCVFLREAYAVTQLIQAADDRNKLEAELYDANHSKGRISSSREASMMGKISAQNKKIKKLENRLGEGEDWVKAGRISWIKEVFPDADINAVTWALGIRLTHWCGTGDRPIRKVPGQHFNTVNAYPAVAIESYKAFLLNNTDEQFNLAELIKKRTSVCSVHPFTRQ